jgi:two-component system invasion response regulator UvrY
MIRVLVADDHAVVRRGLLQMLDEAPAVFIVDQACTGRQALQAAQRERYDVLVLDIAMPEGGGLEVLRELKSADVDLPVLILSMYSEKQYALRALKAGAAGYLTKESAPGELIAAILQVARGGRYVTQSLAEGLVDLLQGELERPPHEVLSDREYQVMCLLAAGNTITEIAAELSLSVKTISTYRARIREKLGLKNTSEIIRYALRRGLVQ